MSRSRLFVCTLSFVALFSDLAIGQAPMPSSGAQQNYRCDQVVANGKDWTSMANDSPGVPEGNLRRFYRADASCVKLGPDYLPTGGGFAYDGAQHDPSMMRRWRQVASIPYDRTYGKKSVLTMSQAAKSWRCVAIDTSKGKPEPPWQLWCIAVCCRWIGTDP